MHVKGAIMKKSALVFVSVAIVSTVIALPVCVMGQACDPASGCCGSGQSYGGQPLFPNAGNVQINPNQLGNNPLPVKPVKAPANKKKLPTSKINSTPASQYAQRSISPSPQTPFVRTSYVLGSLW
jgi:hypothetical protein